jgi:radical SAM/Cys-rich protein
MIESIEMNRFDEKLAAHELQLRRGGFQTLQVNLGRKCNQACRHCHVDASPSRTEMMDRPTAERVGDWIQRFRPAVVDLTGGAPELNPNFRYLVELARDAGASVIDRNNLTILEEPGFEWLPSFLAAHEVEVIASLPCYSAENVNRQRGQGVFEKSIIALRKLNALGYGRGLPLHLVYNPVGPTLPAPQPELEADYKSTLEKDFGIVFNRLFVLTNQPIARFAEDLRRLGMWDVYLDLLVNSFNPATVPELMCRSTLSVGYRGEIYDCDFNQMLEMQWRDAVGAGVFLWDLTPQMLETRAIQTGIHCFACTAGHGSSCTGSLVTQASALPEVAARGV